MGVVLATASLAYAFETQNFQEANLKNRWIAAKFDGKAEKAVRPQHCLEVIQNNDPVFLDNRSGNKLQIAGKKFDRGLYCHAPSHVNVFLPKPAKRFLGIVGIDTNADSTKNGSGSVRFHISANEKELFTSEVLRGAQEGALVDVPLEGVSEFALKIDDGGDGISCDQSDWADARVEFEDGEILYLSDLELLNQDVYDRTLDLDYPFSFVYNGKSSKEFLKDWDVKREKSDVVDGKVTRKLTFTEPNGQLQVVCTAIDYVNYPLVEWTLNFKNLSTDSVTPIIEQVKSIDTIFGREFSERKGFSGWDPDCGDALRWNAEHEFKLHYSIGSPCRQDDYMPLVKQLDPGASFNVATSGGRPTDAHLPYFNLESYRQGWIIVVGWSGQWAANFQRQGELETRVTAGQELTHFSLYPEEEVRSPITVVAPWFRDSWFDAQNIWRRWMIEYNVPRVPDRENASNVKGKIIETHLAACSSHFFAEMTRATTKDQQNFIDGYLKRNIKLDYWWMDAGWYPCEGNWTKVGTWEIDQTRFPGGFRPITDFGHERGVQTIVWFEPERVESGTWLTENHPEWVFGGSNGGLLNISNPEARQWLTDHVDGLLKKEGIDFYRQDYNIAPLTFWRNADAPDRQGISEIRYVEGYLAYWDALLERNPGLRIDSCASGGRRNDLETMRRAVPLLRSDYLLEPVGQQTHTYGIALWIPFFGSGTRAFDDYKIRSLFVPYFNFCYDVREDSSDWDVVRKNLNIWRESIAPYFGGDYYPLTSVSLEQDVWVGWQFNDEEQGKGVVQMFRRPDSSMVAGRFPLHNLDKSAVYQITDVDTKQTYDVSGKELVERGLLIMMETAPCAAIITYQKK